MTDQTGGIFQFKMRRVDFLLETRIRRTRKLRVPFFRRNFRF